MGRFTGILGLLTMLALAYAFSTNRRAIRLKTVWWGLGLQFVFAVFVCLRSYSSPRFLPSFITTALCNSLLRSRR